MADDKKKEDGGRTQYIDRRMKEGKAKDIMMGGSRLLDKVGLRQDKTYAGKSDEEIATKKAKGGFIKEAIKKPGALRKSLGVKKGEKIPAKKLAAASKAPGKMGQRARLAQTLKKMK
jgi:hypothetical protein